MHPPLPVKARRVQNRPLRRIPLPLRKSRAVGTASKLLHGPLCEMHSGIKLAPTTLIFERHYTPKELATLWALDETTIRRLFYDEPGVLKICKVTRLDGK